MAEAVGGTRERYRQQVREEVQQRAWDQIGEAGSSALSLKAIATQMGMTAPALYRYFSSRDELLTQLILSAYAELADSVEAAAGPDGSPADRLIAVGRAMRGWAVTHPQRYLLLYGTPVPGYHAPDAATALARRIFAPILAGFAALSGDATSPAAGHRPMTFWTRLHGVLSLEVAGHFVGMDVDPSQLYERELVELVGN